MKWVEPEVYLVAETGADQDAQDHYLEALGVPEWHALQAASEGEGLIEAGGRMCYRSFDPSLNSNLTKVRSGNLPYIQNIVSSGHGSVLEHASCTFIFRNVSRVFTHELVRHRVGTAFSQESLRYVALDDIPMTKFFTVSEELQNRLRKGLRCPDDPDAVTSVEATVTSLVTGIERALSMWRSHLIQEGDSMQHKKEVTSLLRRLAPIGLATSIMFTANLRALRHLLELRTAPGAEAEIRHVFDRVGDILTRRYPAVFADFTREENGSWIPKYHKV